MVFKNEKPIKINWLQVKPDLNSKNSLTQLCQQFFYFHREEGKCQRFWS